MSTILWSCLGFCITLTLLGVRLELLWGPYALNGIALWMIAAGISVGALAIMFLPYLLLVFDLVSGSESQRKLS